MKAYRFLIVLLLASMWVSACTPTPVPPPPNTDTQPTNAGGTPAAVLKARAELAARLGMGETEVQVDHYAPANWPDSCLGLPATNEMCSQVIVPGFGGLLIAGGTSYEFRTNQEGDSIRMLPGALLKARQFLAQHIQASVEQVGLVSYSQVEWSDACLGLAQEGMMCAEVITPGFQVLLSHQGQEYVVHTDQNGETTLLAAVVEVDAGAYFMSWKFERGEACEAADLSQEGLAYGACDSEKQISSFVSAERGAAARYFVGTFAPFEASTPAGTVSFAGMGTNQATPAEQRMIAEWARLAAQEAAAGGSGAGWWGRAFTWNRTGGLAGFCDDVMVYLTGEAIVSTCQGSVLNSPDPLRLTPAELEQLYAWVDELASFEDSYRDPAAADAISLHLVFSGAGQNTPTVAQKEAINQFASNLYAEAAKRSTPGSELDAAQLALSEFFQLLFQEDYVAALDLYGGDFEELRYFNPDLPQNDLLGLLQRGCQQNGFFCKLTVGNVIETNQTDDITFEITVQLMTPNGELFQLGPCCGADPASNPPVTRFTYNVQKIDGRYRVLELPPWTP
jgi:hypothetical protein